MIQKMSLQALSQRFGGVLVNGDIEFDQVNTDTRQFSDDSVSSALFVALKGERYDAHDFLQAAFEKGACGFVVEHQVDNISVPQWVVEDTTLALGYIARFQRENFLGSVVAITGSSGKTTVKGMLNAILQVAVGSDKTFATPGNLNNHIGVPLSLLLLQDAYKYAVIEMGASAMGEIDYLVRIAQPVISLVNNVMPAHVEGFGSIDNIAIAKGEIYSGLPDNGIAVINLDDNYAPQWLAQNAQRKVISFSVDPSKNADVYASHIELGNNGHPKFSLFIKNSTLPLQLQILGKHNVSNAIAAAACAYSLGVSIENIVDGLQNFCAEAGRLQALNGIKSSVLIDDSYNANPGSVCAAIDVLSEIPLKKVLVLGDMAELGPASEKAHGEVGKYARHKNIDYLLAIGNSAKIAAENFGDNGFYFESNEQLIEKTKAIADQKTAFLIKGSRSSRMDRVVQALIQRGEKNASLAC